MSLKGADLFKTLRARSGAFGAALHGVLLLTAGAAWAAPGAGDAVAEPAAGAGDEVVVDPAAGAGDAATAGGGSQPLSPQEPSTGQQAQRAPSTPGHGQLGEGAPAWQPATSPRPAARQAPLVPGQPPAAATAQPGASDLLPPAVSELVRQRYDKGELTIRRGLEDEGFEVLRGRELVTPLELALLGGDAQLAAELEQQASDRQLVWLLAAGGAAAAGLGLLYGSFSVETLGPPSRPYCVQAPCAIAYDADIFDRRYREGVNAHNRRQNERVALALSGAALEVAAAVLLGVALRAGEIELEQERARELVREHNRGLARRLGLPAPAEATGVQPPAR